MSILYDMNENIPDDMSNFEWHGSEWSADWGEHYHLEGESVDADHLQVGDIVISYNGARIECIGRVVEIDGFGYNVYPDHRTFDYYLDMEHPGFCSPFFMYSYENSGITVVREIEPK